MFYTKIHPVKHEHSFGGKRLKLFSMATSSLRPARRPLSHRPAPSCRRVYRKNSSCHNRFPLLQCVMVIAPGSADFPADLSRMSSFFLVTASGQKLSLAPAVPKLYRRWQHSTKPTSFSETQEDLWPQHKAFFFTESPVCLIVNQQAAKHSGQCTPIMCTPACFRAPCNPSLQRHSSVILMRPHLYLHSSSAADLLYVTKDS